MSKRIEMITNELEQGNTVTLTLYAGRVVFTPAALKRFKAAGADMFRENNGHLEYRKGQRWVQLLNGTYKATVERAA